MNLRQRLQALEERANPILPLFIWLDRTGPLGNSRINVNGEEFDLGVAGSQEEAMQKAGEVAVRRVPGRQCYVVSWQWQ